MTKQQFDNWYKAQWLPEARQLTNQLAVLSRFLEKQEKPPSRETLDALSDKFANIRNTMIKVNEELIKLESRTI